MSRPTVFWGVLVAVLVIAAATGVIGWGDTLWIFGGAGLVSFGLIAMQRRQNRAR